MVPWHQDNAYWKLTPPQAASCWLALDDATVENGCMWVIPGSHRTGKAPHGQAGKFTSLLDTEADESKAVPVELPAGAAMFHHCQTLHSTYENRSPHQRRAWVLHYMPADTRQEDRPLTDRLLLCRE